MLLFVALLPLPAVEAALVFGGPSSTIPVELRHVGDGWEGTAAVPFHLTGASWFYAKIIATDRNPVHDGGRSNGTTAANHSEGLSGWWAEFRFRGPQDLGQPGNSNASNETRLGAYADGTPTPPVLLRANETRELHILLHAPADAFDVARRYEVFIALALGAAPGETTGVTGSGATRNEATAIRLVAEQGQEGDFPANSSPDSNLAARLVLASAVVGAGFLYFASWRKRPR